MSKIEAAVAFHTKQAEEARKEFDKIMRLFIERGANVRALNDSYIITIPAHSLKKVMEKYMDPKNCMEQGSE